jgi:hypothetical protein
LPSSFHLARRIRTGPLYRPNSLPSLFHLPQACPALVNDGQQAPPWNKVARCRAMPEGLPAKTTWKQPIVFPALQITSTRIDEVLHFPTPATIPHPSPTSYFVILGFSSSLKNGVALSSCRG